jgi:hypothetical protein
VTTTQVNKIHVSSSRRHPIENLLFVAIYVDDGGIIVTPDAIKVVITALGKVSVKTMGEMETFVCCHNIDTIEKDGV